MLDLIKSVVFGDII